MYFMALYKAVFLHLQMSVFSQTNVALQLFWDERDKTVLNIIASSHK